MSKWEWDIGTMLMTGDNWNTWSEPTPRDLTASATPNHREINQWFYIHDSFHENWSVIPNIFQEILLILYDTLQEDGPLIHDAFHEI